MKRFVALIKNLLPKEAAKPVGRWKLDYCHTKINSKVDLSNEDHCGPCGQYSLAVKEEKTNANNLTKE